MGKLSKQVWKNNKLTKATKIKAYTLFTVTPSIGQYEIDGQVFGSWLDQEFSAFPYTCAKSITLTAFSSSVCIGLKNISQMDLMLNKDNLNQSVMPNKQMTVLI